MRASSTRRNRPRRYTARLLIKLDAEAHAMFETLRRAVGRLPTQVLRHVIDWGLCHGATWHVDRRRVPPPTHSIVVRLEPEVRPRVHGAANAAGGDASAWVCHLLHRVTLADLPATWQTGEADLRSHDSRRYGKRYMMRLDAPTRQKLDDFAERFNKSAAEIIRHLVAHATIEDFPPDWQTVAPRRRAHPRQARSPRRNMP